MKRDELSNANPKKRDELSNANPKLDPHPPSNTEKNPDEWVSGEEPMTGAQASYLKTLSEETGHKDAYAEDLTKAEASKRIDALKGERDGRGRRRHGQH
jgi:hypothetical protein